mmetsp:Transcript_28777/g.79296  ORF Transcript_28777/g.79296 Transcript_28777/m.79296 type:complete len:594 (+) Transcript_28777:127-1908(+)
MQPSRRRTIAVLAAPRSRLKEQQRFGSGSIFDAQVVDASSPCFELPVKAYLDEAVIGMNGAPESGGRPDARWTSVRSILNSEPAAQVCEAFTWAAIGELWDTVAQSAQDEFRRQLSQSWFSLTLKVKKQHKQADRQDAVLGILPTVFVQAAYRLILDAFPEEKKLLTQSAGAIIEKLMILMHFEVAGFHQNAERCKMLREQVFRKQVIQNPFLNQHESQRSEMRREKLENNNATLQELKFGGENDQPLDPEQLEHLFELRAMEQEQPSAEPTIDPELSVDRYTEVIHKGNDMFLKHFFTLYPSGQPDLGMTNDGTESGSDEDSDSSPESPKTPWPVTTQGRGKRFFGSLIGMRESDEAIEKRRREAEAAERRRRDELFGAKVAAPLKEKYRNNTLNTNLVSPVIDRLAPGEGDRNLLQKRSAEAQRMRMSAPSRAGALPAAERPTSKSSRPQKSSAQSKSATVLPKLDATLYGTSATLYGTSNFAEGQKTEGMKYSIPLMDPPFNTKHQVVMMRLEQQRDMIYKHSFDQYKKEHDILTGNEKNKVGGWEEYLSKTQALVGSRSVPALKLIGPRRNARVTLSAIDGRASFGSTA